MATIWTTRALALCAATLLACGTRSVERYQTRGLVTALDGEGEQLRVAIHHEPLPTFKDREGELAPMHSMVMMFGLAPDVPRAELAPQRKLAIEFEVHWDQRPTLLITRVRRLPDDTALSLQHGH